MKERVAMAVVAAVTVLNGLPALGGEVSEIVHAEEVSPGARVRVEAYGASSRILEGQVMSVDDETLTLVIERADSNHTGVARIRMADIRNVELWRGQRRAGGLGRAFGVGFGLGAAAGITLGRFVYGIGEHEGGPSSETIALRCIALGGAAGGLLGLALQAASVKDVWEPASLPGTSLGVSLAPAPGRGWQAGVAVRF